MKDIVYFDHAATTPMDDEVIDVMTQAFRDNYGNASSIHQIGKKNRVSIEQARKKMADSIGATEQEIIITSGGTESDNMALIKTAEAYAHKGKHIISTAIEHPAVLESLNYLQKKGFEISYLSADKNGQIKLDDLKQAIRPDTILVSVMYVNNETGAIQPIVKIGEYLDTLNQQIYFHTDAVQAYDVLDIHVDQLKVDLLSVSAHKMNGPKGIGFLYIRKDLKIPSLIVGGAQENNRRAGTENVPAILGFEKAIELSISKKEERQAHLQQLKYHFIEKMEASNLNYSINGTVKEATPHIISVCFPQKKSDMLLIQMDLNGIAVSAGSACSAGSLEDSHVLINMYGEDAPEVTHTIRFSFGVQNTIREVDQVVETLKKYAV